MNEKEQILLSNLQEYTNYAEDAFRKKSYNTATTLFFKALVAACDLFLLRNESIVPSSHTHRFEILKLKHKEFYDLLDRDFPFYQESYTHRMNKEAAQLLKEDVETIKKKLTL